MPLTYGIGASIPAARGVGFAWRFIRPGDAGESLDPRRARSSQPANYARDGGASVRFFAVSRHGHCNDAHGCGERIFVYTGSDMFRCASRPLSMRQCLLRLASAVVHEAWHLENGRDEEEAYEEQIAFLLRNGAGTEHVNCCPSGTAARSCGGAAGDRRRAATIQVDRDRSIVAGPLWPPSLDTGPSPQKESATFAGASGQ